MDYYKISRECLNNTANSTPLVKLFVPQKKPDVILQLIRHEVVCRDLEKNPTITQDILEGFPNGT